MITSNKKGVEMTVNVVVIITLSLIVLVVLLYFLTGGFQSLNKGTACEPTHGKCQAACGTGEYSLAWRCSDSKQSCCSTNPIGG